MKKNEFEKLFRVVKQLFLLSFLFARMSNCSNEISENISQSLSSQNLLKLLTTLKNYSDKIDPKTDKIDELNNQNDIDQIINLKKTSNSHFSSKVRKLAGKVTVQKAPIKKDVNNKAKENNYYQNSKASVDMKSLQKSTSTTTENMKDNKSSSTVSKQSDAIDCGCPDGTSSTQWFSSLHYRMNGFRTLFDYSELHIESWVDYLNDFMSGRVKNNYNRDKDPSIYKKIGPNHEIESVDYEFVYGIWLTDKKDSKGFSEVNFYPESLGDKYILRIYNMKYQSISRSTEYFTHHLKRWVNWKNAMIEDQKGTNYDPSFDKNDEENDKTSNAKTEKDPTVFEEPSNYLPLSLYPIRTQTASTRRFYADDGRTSLKQQYYDLILFIFGDEKLGPDPRWLDDLRQDEDDAFEKDSDFLLCTDVEKLQTVLEKFNTKNSEKVIDQLRNENLADFVRKDQNMLYRKQNDVVFYNLPEEEQVYWTYFFEVLSTTTLTQLLEGLEAMVGFQQYDRFKSKAQLNFDNSMTKNIDEMLFETGNRPVVVDLNIKLKNTLTGNTEVYSYWFIMSYQLTALNPQRTGQGFKIKMNWVRRGNKKRKFYDISSEFIDSASPNDSGVKNCIVTTDFEKLIQKQKNVCDYVTFVKWDRAVTYPDMFSRTICRAAKAGLHQLFKKLSSDISSQTPAWNYDNVCPSGNYLSNIRKKTKKTFDYDFNCVEFKAYLQKYTSFLNEKSDFEYFKDPNIFDETGKTLNHESLIKILSFIEFNCMKDKNIYDPLESRSTTGYMKFDERIIGTFEFKRKYKIEKIATKSEVNQKRIDFAKNMFGETVDFINDRDHQKGGFTKFEKINFTGSTNQDQEDGDQTPEVPDGDFNNMCFKIEFTLTQNVYSFIECFKYLPFDPEDNPEDLMIWRYHRVLLHFFKLSYTAFLSVSFQFTPNYIANEFTKIGGEFEMVLFKNDLQTKKNDNLLRSVLFNFSLKKFEQVTLRLEIYLSNVYYLRFFIKTSHQEFEIFIERYPIYMYAYLLVKTEKSLYLSQNNIDKSILDQISTSPFDKLENIRKKAFEEKYLPKIKDFLISLFDVNKGYLNEDLTDIEIDDIFKDPTNKCLEQYAPSDFVSFPLLAEILQQIFLKIHLKEISDKSTNGENDFTFEEGSWNEKSQIIMIANSFQPNNLESVLFNHIESFFESDEEAEHLKKLSLLTKIEHVNCKTSTTLFGLYKDNFLSNYWSLFKLQIDEQKFAYVFVNMHAFETDALYFFYFSFKCQYFQQDFVIPYSQIKNMQKILHEIIFKKLSHLWKAVEMTFREANDDSDDGQKIPSLDLFTKEIDGLFEKLLLEKNGQKIEKCVPKQNAKIDDVLSTYCVKDKTLYNKDPIVSFREPKVIAIVYKINNPNDYGINIQVNARNIKALFAKDPKKYENVPSPSSYKIPLQNLTKNNWIIKTHLKEIVAVVEVNLPKS